MDCLSKIVQTEPFQLLFGSIYAKIKNFFKIHSNYKDLERKMEFVSALESRLREGLDDDQLRYRLPTTQVEDWLKRVEELKEIDVTGTVPSPVLASALNSCCSLSRHCELSNNIVKQIEEAKLLIEEGRPFENMMVGVNPVPKPRPVQYIEAPSIKGQPTASANLAKMMDMLKNDKYKRIGVWGMGGVGKTTLVKNLNKELSEHPTTHPFSIIIFVVVSQNASVEKVQSRIAERLKLEVNNEESKESVADSLLNKLKGEIFLLILDDVWDEINLDDVGIPRPKDHTGSKIILTTRKNYVCQQMLTDYNFNISSLSHEEAWNLFSQTVGEEVLNDDQIRQSAENIVKECDGLPLAIITVGASLRKKTEIALWKNALKALQKSDPAHIRGVEEKVYKPLKWSYDSLEGDDLRSCFLFFCLFPEDFEVDTRSLVWYWLSEGLLDERLNYEQLHDGCINIVESLKDSCLLEKGSYQGRVKMHDIVRDVGIWIASSLENGCKSIVHVGGGATRISQEEMLNFSNRVKRISFMDNNIANLPYCKVQCHETSTLFLQGNKNLQEVPCSFLEAFQKLRILDLGGSKIKFLPNSLLQLGELRALLLSDCDELFELPPLATLGKLQVLHCNGTAITKLPEDFGKLTNLRQLDLSYTRKLSKFPKCTDFSNLRSLEFLDMFESGFKWGIRKTNEENVAFEQLLCLDRLVAFYIKLKDIPRDVTDEHVSWIRRMNDFFVYISPTGKELPFLWNFEKCVCFSDIHFTGEESVEWLLENAFNFTIRECEGVDLMLGNLVMNKVSICCFANLKSLSMERLRNSVKPSSLGRFVAKFDLLPNLEMLYICDFTGLQSLSDLSNFLGLRFTKLKRIWLIGCDQLENLLTMDGMLQKLENLEEVNIWRCEKLTTIFKNASSDNFVPNLRILKLYNLPTLEGEGICTADVSWQSLKELSVENCDMLRKLPLGIQNAESIQLIRGEQHWWNELQWDNENFKMRLQSHFKPRDA